ncbi:MAG TPA: PTS system mannose/fructose/sorbose family transporter subunit IID [Gemmatimonadales bacterium]|nr:PTS system mannose/fructose/sorbose family transporter subunit IID [Gemmatimonadales bacterium]HRZ08481.1 PTS system mannose/fructose/sorbose family transporter subunit IID [Gemmatimonadales bacterium]
MKGKGRALVRLLAVQGAWSYERMTGVGMGFAAEPLLRALESDEPEHHREATARAAEFFNCHPYLAGLALGASARAEYEGVPGAQIRRLRTALCSPLGALGDQFFWAGLVPIMMSLALVGVALGAGAVGLATVVIGYNVARLLVTRWALWTGLETGMQVGTAISASWLPRAAARIAAPAGLVAGLAVPVVGAWLLSPVAGPRLAVTLLAAGATLALVRWGGARWTSLRVGLVFALVVLLWTRFAP